MTTCALAPPRALLWDRPSDNESRMLEMADIPPALRWAVPHHVAARPRASIPSSLKWGHNLPRAELTH